MRAATASKPRKPRLKVVDPVPVKAPAKTPRVASARASRRAARRAE
jgi:hypothetical protein